MCICIYIYSYCTWSSKYTNMIPALVLFEPRVVKSRGTFQTWSIWHWRHRLRTHLILDVSTAQQWKVKVIGILVDDPNDVIPRQRQLQIVTFLKYDGTGAIADLCLCRANVFDVFVGISCYDLYFDLWWFKICGTVGFGHLRATSYSHFMLVFVSVVGGDLFNISVSLLDQMT